MQCKTSIGNNSSPIEDKDVKFACSVRFVAMADRMVWLPSLSCDCSRVVGLRVEGSLVMMMIIVIKMYW